MTPNTKAVLRDIGLFLHIPGLMSLISLLVCLAWGEYYVLIPFLVTAIAALGGGQLLYRNLEATRPQRVRYAVITSALGWGIIPLLGAIPFFLTAVLASTGEASPTLLVFLDPWNALFDSVAGYTSTGLSMAEQPSQLPHSLQWWRTFTEWIGGVGMVVLVIAVLEPSSDPTQLYNAEARQEEIALTVRSTVRRIWRIYVFYSLIGVLWLRLVGMPWWDALNHGLAGISTGGFSIRDDSIEAYGPLIELATIPVMLVGAIAFPVHYHLWRDRRLQALWSNSQHRTLWVLLLGGSFLLLIFNLQSTGFFQFSVLVDSLVQWTSALATCGFMIADLNAWSPSAKLLLTLAMIAGGTAGSTAGGLKLYES